MTIGQYLQPYEKRLPVERYVTPEEFAEWKEIGRRWASNMWNRHR